MSRSLRVHTISCALCVALGVVGCGGRKEQVPDAGAQQAAIEVRVAPVRVLAVPRTLTLTGSVIADQQSEVAANVSGQITQTRVERGDRVKAGQVLAVVDPKQAGLNAAAARAQARAAQSQSETARRECERADTLLEKGAISRSEHERLTGVCGTQAAQANAARATARIALDQAGDTVIRAPITGVVGERFVDVGEYVQAQSRVATLFAIDPARVTISVPEPMVGLVQPGQRLEVEVSSWEKRTFPATVRLVSPNLRPDTRDRIIEAFAPNSEGLLLPGMFATVALRVGEERLPTVPVEAIKIEGNVRRLFLVREGKAFALVVRVGVTHEGRIAVLEELAEGELVIVDPPAQLRDGAPVAIPNQGPPRTGR